MRHAPSARVSEAEYLRRSALSEERLEFYNGDLVAMSGSTEARALVTANLVSALVARLRGTGCRVYSSDLRVHIGATGAWVYPDVTVVCGVSALTPGAPPSVRNPRFVVEVLSAATEHHDRGAKAAHYRRIPSLAGYLLVDVDARRVELLHRGDDGEWRLREAEDDGVLSVPTPPVELQLAELWDGLEHVGG